MDLPGSMRGSEATEGDSTGGQLPGSRAGTVSRTRAAAAKGGGSRTGNGRNYTMAQCPNHWLTLKISLDLVTVM